MVSLHYLKYMYDLIEKGVLELWVENPYRQHISGMKSFEHQAPIEASSLSLIELPKLGYLLMPLKRQGVGDYSSAPHLA